MDNEACKKQKKNKKTKKNELKIFKNIQKRLENRKEKEFSSSET